MKEWYEKLTFSLCGDGNQFCGRVEDEIIIRAEFEKGMLSLFLTYDVRKEPLVLKSRAEAGNTVCLIKYPYRLEMYVEGVLKDEEWPFGICPLTEAAFEGRVFPAVDVLEAAEKVMPAVLGTFVNAEGWRPEEQIFVGDCMPYVHQDRFHVLYLKDRHHHHSKWGKGAHQWEHISTEDFKTWAIHPMAVPIDNPAEGSICTGSWFCTGERQYLYYTVRMADGSSAPICRSVSQDGYHFEKDRSFRFTLSGRYTGASARDPKIFKDGEGILHMLVTTTDVGTKCGCLAHLTSPDGEVWREEGNLYDAPDADEPECSDYFSLGDYDYLVFSHRGTAQYRYFKRPFKQWIIPEVPMIPCESVPKAAVWKGKIVFVGFVRMEGYGGSMTFRTARADEKGELIF